MTCEDFQLRLTAFSLGELEQGEVSDARDHVATCDDCASRLLLDRQLTALLRASAVPAPQETVTAVLVLTSNPLATVKNFPMKWRAGS